MVRWMLAAAALACLVLQAATASAQAPALVFTALGTDPEGDDTNASTGAPAGGLPIGLTAPCPSPPAGDCSSIDDILSVAVGATASEVVFRLTVKEMPSQSSLVQGQYCWLAGFQVAGSEDERIVMGCLDYQNGSPTPDTEATTTRGENIASAAAWVADQPIFEIRAPLSAFGGKVGTQLVDIYGLTYIGEGLGVDDAAPDAKSDRAASESLGSYTIGGSGGGGGGNGGPATTYVVLDGEKVDETVERAEAFTGRVQYNWTAPDAAVELRVDATVGNGTVAVRAADSGGAELYSKSFNATGTDSHEVPAGRAGTWRITVDYTGFRGKLVLQAEPVAGGQGTGTSSSSTSSSTSGSGTSGSDSATSTSSSSTKGTPLPWLLPLAAVALALASRRR